MPKRDVADFISHWKGATAPEHSISQQFLCDLCDLLDVPHPGNQRNGSSTFEFHVSETQHGVTLTGLYNVLEKIRQVGTLRCDVPARAFASSAGGSEIPLAESGEAPAGSAQRANPTCLTEKEKSVHDRGLVSTLKSLHDDLDAAVSAAYGWPASLTDAEILERLVALNAERAAEEARGVIHWLRPEYQIKAVGGTSYTSPTLNLPESKPKPSKKLGTRGTRPSGKSAWPKTLPERMHAMETALHAAAAPILPDDLAAQFARAKPADVTEILKTLETFGRARRAGEGKFKA